VGPEKSSWGSIPHLFVYDIYFLSRPTSAVAGEYRHGRAHA
jgi:hypothetical protein